MSSDISREDILVLLAAMGVELSKSTKIPDSTLNKYLQEALNASQRFGDIIKITPFDPSNYSGWKSSKPLLDAVSRGNTAEAFENIMLGRRTSHKPSSAKEDTFKEVRQIVLGLSYHYDREGRNFVLMDAAAEWGIAVRIIDLLSLPLGDQLNNEVPIFMLLYKVLYRTADRPLNDHLAQIFDGEVVSLTTTELERKTMLKIFAHNSKNLSSNYKSPSKPNGDSSQLTFLLPLGPLSMRDLGRLNSRPGCEVCGKRVTSRCTQCLIVSYCGIECQREDWKVHKQCCRTLKGGTWHTLTLEKSGVPVDKAGARTIINRYDSIQDAQANVETDFGGPPPNRHGNKFFLIKLQISLHQFGDEVSMLIYDRQKSFQGFWKKKNDRSVFMEGEKAMAGKLKIYRWAQRVGDYELSVCFDRAPEKDPVW